MAIANQTIALENGADTLTVDYLQLKKAALILRSLNHNLRLQIVKLIDEYEKITVTEIYVKLKIEQSVASQHLAILRRSNVVKAIREGKFIYYKLDYDRIGNILDVVTDLLK